MSKVRIAYWLRLLWAPLLIAIEFTNLSSFYALGGRDQIPPDPHSPYGFQIATYGVCGLILALDRSNAPRLVQKRIFKWTFAVLTLFTWGMLVRTFYAPPGIPSYDFFRTFGLQVHAIGFMLACIVIFDHPKVLAVAKTGVVWATLLGVALNLYELLHPGTFSSVDGRAAGLYVNSNDSGVALVFGCLVGLTAIRPRWREIFVVLVAAGVIVTFSREAMLAFGIVTAGALLGRSLLPHRLIVGGVLAFALFSALELGNSLGGSQSWSASNIARLGFGMEDASAAERLSLGRNMLEEFEAAPLFGHGFGTDEYGAAAQPSHDFFLNMLANYGILGAFIIPALLLSVRRKSWDSNVFALVFLTWSFFMHLVLVQPFSMVIIAIEAAEPPQPKRLHAPANAPPIRRYSYA